MSNEVALFEQNTSSALAPSMQALMASMAGAPSEYASGVLGGFAVVSIRGKIWRIKHAGDEQPVMRTPTEQALSIEVVLVKGSEHLSKIYYEGSYNNGDDAPPDCWSSNGITPAASVAKKQSPTCAACPKNAWGSKITENQKKAKACADSRRLAIVPLGDIDNESYGGPMLLRVPPASLGELAAFDGKMRGMGYPLFAIGVRVAFDINSEYQKLVYSAIRPLTEAEAQKVLALRDDPRVARILDAGETAGGAEPAAVPEQVFEQPTPAAAPPTPAAAVQPAKPAAAPRKATPAATPAATSMGGMTGGAVPQAAQPAQSGGLGGGMTGGSSGGAQATAPEAATDDLDALLDDLLPQ